MPFSLSDIDVLKRAILDKTDKSYNSKGCWKYTGTIHKSKVCEYGVINMDVNGSYKRNVKVHRILKMYSLGISAMALPASLLSVSYVVFVVK